METLDLLSATLLLIIVTDPLGNIPMVLTCLQGVKNKPKFILREVFLAALVLCIFLILGPRILQMLDLSEEAMQLAGGILLFIIALKMIFPTNANWLGGEPGEEPILFPLAVPLIAGPSAVATVVLFSAQYPEQMGTWLLAILLSMSTSLISFFSAVKLHRFMGTRGLAAMQRLMGMLLTAIAVQMILHGIETVIHDLNKLP